MRVSARALRDLLSPARSFIGSGGLNTPSGWQSNCETACWNGSCWRQGRLRATGVAEYSHAARHYNLTPCLTTCQGAAVGWAQHRWLSSAHSADARARPAQRIGKEHQQRLRSDTRDASDLQQSSGNSTDSMMGAAADSTHNDSSSEDSLGDAVEMQQHSSGSKPPEARMTGAFSAALTTHFGC